MPSKYSGYGVAGAASVGFMSPPPPSTWGWDGAALLPADLLHQTPCLGNPSLAEEFPGGLSLPISLLHLKWSVGRRK